MKYPTLTELNSSREMIDVFRGYNHNLRIGEGEFYDMTNLTSNDYPVLSPRPQRGVYASPTKPLGMISKDALCYVDGSDFIINEYRIGMSLDPETPKTLISMGAYVIIMPDKKYINTANLSDYGNIEASVTIDRETPIRYSPCLIDGSSLWNYDDSGNQKLIYRQETAPENPKNLDYWIDTSSIPYVLKRYANDQWTSIATNYIKISAEGIGIPFAEGDGVVIESDLGTIAVEHLKGTPLVIQARDDNYIVVIGEAIMGDSVNGEGESQTKLTITRKMPDMDFVIESGNRLWGCKYGVALNGQVVNEIYASKLGDFKNWNTFAGISTDSYVASVGTDGQFTGAITHLGYPIFFKENCMHKVYGNYPANYQIQTTACRGVQNGCSKSLAIVNETLYYKSRSGICGYDGSLPVEISSALGDVSYAEAVAGVLGNKYYISMRDVNETESSKKHHLFVYDTQKGMWHREDNTQALEFCNCDGELYYIDYATEQIKTVKGTGLTDTSPIKWEATTGIIGTDSPDKKYISRIVMRLSLELGTRLYIQAQYDSCGAWEQISAISGTSLKTFSIPIKPRRCDHLRLRFIGEGAAKIFSITKTIEQGSDV